MAEIINDVEHLSREIGPRPAGTEEERVAAMYIAENIQKRSGLSFDIEDFEGAKGRNRAFHVCAIVSSFAVLLASLLAITTWPAFVVAAISAVIMVMEMLEKPVISNFLRYGISQNVVAKYEPGFSAENQRAQRKRKIVIVSHYDSGHATNGNSDGSLSAKGISLLASLAAVCVVPLFLLIKGIVFSSSSSLLLSIIIALILAVIALSPIALDFMESRRQYSDGANCNGSGSAALIEIARQLGTGSYASADDPEGERPVIRGKGMAEKSGLIPEGCEVKYNADENLPKDPLIAQEQSLADAKAAIAAFTAPRAPRKQYDDDGNVVAPEAEKPKAPVLIDDAAAERAQTEDSFVPKEKSNTTPSWFKSAQSKAKKDDTEVDRSQVRSRFAHTMDYMAEKKEAEQKRIEAEEEARRAKLRERIVAAQKAAEEERKEELGEETPFYREEKPSLEDRFNREQSEPVKVHEPEPEPEPEPEQTSEIPVVEAENDPESTSFIEPVPVESVIEQTKQYAPLADENFVSSNEVPQNSSIIDLPEVFTDDPENDPEYAKALNESDQELEKGKFGTGSFAAISESEGVAGATGTFAPVSEELMSDASKSGEMDIIVKDADDSVYSEGTFTDTGAFAGSGYVDIPDKKPNKLFGIFGRKKDSGKHAHKNDGFVQAKPYQESDPLLDDEWEGGAYNDAVTSGKQRIEPIVDAVPEFDQQIQEFHNSSINLDVWMVALGSEIGENAGIKSFLLEHAQELKGAIIIDIEGFGAGELSLVNSEGYIKKSKTSSRIKRYVRQAANKLEMKIPSIDIPWSSSSAAYANKLGYNAIRLVGSDGRKPAYYLQADDVVENVDEETIKKNVDYIMQLIQTI